MKTRRGLMAGLLVAALVTAGVTAFLLLRPGLPPPSESSRQQVLYWLVTRDLSQESPETRLALVRRLEEESLLGLRWDGFGDELSPAHRTVLWKNVSLLVEPWLNDKTDRYFSLPDNERTAYLNEVLDLVDLWQGLDVLRPAEPSPADQGGKGGFLTVFLGQMSCCVEQTSSDARRQQLAEFAMALQTRWLTRSLWGK